MKYEAPRETTAKKRKTITTSTKNGQNEANVAVLIDHENVGIDSIQYLLDQLSDVGRAIIRRAYADWSDQRKTQDQLLDLGIEPVHNYRSNKSGKNSSDIRLAIDAVDLLYGAPIDTFVIVSSDSDFVPLVRKLRSAGKAVIGSGRRDVTPSTLVKSCDRYIFLNEQKPNLNRQRRDKSRGVDANSLVVRAMEASMDQEGHVVGSKLHNTMQRIDPSFSFKSLGHNTFRQFLSSCKEVTYTQPRDASDVVVQLSYMRERGLVEADGTAQRKRPARNEPRPSANRPNRITRPSVAPTSVVTAVIQPDTPESGNVRDWERDIEAAWTKRGRDQLSGRVAAGDASKVLDAPRLSASQYPTLDQLLGASDYLSSRWRRDGNAILKK